VALEQVAEAVPDRDLRDLGQPAQVPGRRHGSQSCTTGAVSLRRGSRRAVSESKTRATTAAMRKPKAYEVQVRVRVRVLAARPSSSYGELHGLYDPEIPPPLVTLWMRTAAKRRVVAYKSFLRTLVHELLHHLDYELFRFDESFHTEGFFQRESSIARQLLGTEQSPAGPERPSGR